MKFPSEDKLQDWKEIIYWKTEFESWLKSEKQKTIPNMTLFTKVFIEKILEDWL